MCGRYASSQPPEFIARLFRTVNALPNVAPSWNIAPSQDAMVVRRHPEAGERHLDLLQWGLVPHWSKDPPKTKHPINARAETVATSGMFHGSFAPRRCLAPADAFYEWKATEGGKQPFAVARHDGQPMAFAGLWEGYRWLDGTVLRTFAIITTNANADMTGLHDRMPLILDQADWPAWLGEAEGDRAALLRLAPDGTLRTWPVSTRVNAPRNNDAALLAPLLLYGLPNPLRMVPRLSVLCRRGLAHLDVSRPLQILDQSLGNQGCPEGQGPGRGSRGTGIERRA
jgi:putative SOS response-associated peptidase YedK